MIMIDQSKRLSQPLEWTRAGRAAVAAAAVCVLLALIAGGIYALSAPGRGGERQGCIDVTFPSTLGAANVHECGGRARAFCAAPGAQVAASIGAALQASCARAGYAYGVRAGGS